MCFNNDYDWSASVYFDDVVKAERWWKCMECGLPILEGEYFRVIEMWEHEYCQRCEETKAGTGDECDCKKPDFGEQFTTRRCLCCDQMLRAIEAAEIEEGCSGDETRPPLEQMIEGLQYADDRQRYFDKARAMFPILETNGYLKLIEGIFAEE